MTYKIVTLEQILDCKVYNAIWIVPTETVYGLVTIADDAYAIDNLKLTKGRAPDKPFPICISDIEQAKEVGIFSEKAIRLAKKFWPGPLTIVVPRNPCCGFSDLKTVALRCPDIFWREAICESGPHYLTSANKSGSPAPKTYHVDLEDSTYIYGALDSGPCEHGIASTIISVIGDEVKILRDGALEKKELHKWLYKP